MDKNEYNLRLAEIEEYVGQGDYAAAAKDADTIEWKRVRNVRTLCMVSEIYEAVGRYDDSKKLLLRAYKRSPVGRTILYRLVEVTIHLKQFDEAIEYYTEYCQAAPHDNNRYILKYKIYRGRGSSVDEQIEILREYLKEEYDEKYAYELALRYREADRIDECLTACDDLVLWFHNGKYVIKALELKKEYRPLTPKQQEIYDHRFDAETDSVEEAEADAEAIGQEKKIVEDPETSRTQEILDDTERSIAMEIAAAAREQEAESNFLRDTAEEAAEKAEEAAEEAAEVAAEVEEAVETVAEETEEVVPAPEPISPEVLASRVAESMRQITSGIGMRPTVDPDKEAEDAVIEESKLDQVDQADENAVKPEETAETAESEKAAKAVRPAVVAPEAADERKPRGFKLPEFGKTAPAAKKLTIDDLLLSMGERGEAVREAAAKAHAEEKKQPEGVLSAVDEALLNMSDKNPEEILKEEEIAEEAAEEAAETADTAEDAAETVSQEAAELAAEAEEKAEAVAEAAEEAAEEVKEDVSEKVSEEQTELSREAEAVKEAGRELAAAFARDPKPETAEETEEVETEKTEAESLEEVEEAIEEDEILSAKTRVIPTEEIARRYSQTPIDLSETEDVETAETVATEEVNEEAAEPTETGAEEKAEASEEAEAAEVNKEETFATAADLDLEPQLDNIDLDDEEEEEEEEEPLDEEENEEEESKEPEAPRRRLAPQIRGLFEGFLEIDHLEDQIAYAIEQALAKKGEKTSRTGNIVIFGGHGCGKTTIAIGLAKAIAQLRGDRAVKMARIYATDLNRKDIPKTIAKIAGGILIVEEAGDLDDTIVDQLTTAMEFRTDGMIMILEDEQKYIRERLNKHPRFTMKFTSQIYIPIFTPNELIDFAQTHAEEQGYTLSESAAEVLSTKIEKLGEEGEPVSIINMNELVDNAIVRANKFGRKMFSGKNRYDERGRVILIDKDFR